MNKYIGCKIAWILCTAWKEIIFHQGLCLLKTTQVLSLTPRAPTFGTSGGTFVHIMIHVHLYDSRASV